MKLNSHYSRNCNWYDKTSQIYPPYRLPLLLTPSPGRFYWCCRLRNTFSGLWRIVLELPLLDSSDLGSMGVHYYGSDNPDNCCTMVYLLYIPDQCDSTASPDLSYYSLQELHNYTSLLKQLLENSFPNEFSYLTQFNLHTPKISFKHLLNVYICKEQNA